MDSINNDNGHVGHRLGSHGGATYGHVQLLFMDVDDCWLLGVGVGDQKKKVAIILRSLFYDFWSNHISQHLILDVTSRYGMLWDVIRCYGM